MLNGNFRGQPIGSGTSVWQMSEDVRAGKMSCEDFADAESCMSRSAGHCMTMGTASNHGMHGGGVGMGMPQNAAIPAGRFKALRSATGGRKDASWTWFAQCEDVANLDQESFLKTPFG